MNKYKLIKTNYDYSDEFNVPSFVILSEKTLKDWKSEIKKFFSKKKKDEDYEFTVGFGSNQEIYFGSYYEIFEQDYEELDITLEELKLIEKFFPKDNYNKLIEFGNCPLTRVYEHVKLSQDDDFELVCENEYE